MERLALPQPSYVENIEVNNGNLIDYLMVFNNSFFRGNTSFAPELDLGSVEPYLRELHQTEQLGYVIPVDEQQKVQFQDPVSIRNPLFREIEIQRQRMWKNILEDRRPVERYRSIYLDGSDDAVKVSDITHGEYTSTTTDTLDLFKRGHNPLFEIHSHPIDSLFSDADYQRMIMDVTVAGGMRILRGAILVCPNIQILALATPQTMFTSPEQVELFRKKYDLEDSETGRRIRKIQMELGEMIDEPFVRLFENAANLSRLSSEEIDYYVKGLYSDQEFGVVKERLMREHATFVDTVEQGAISRLKEVGDPLIVERRRLHGLEEMEIAREVNAKLYIATDFRHFKEFTA